MKNSARPIILTDSNSVNWRVVVYHEGPIRQLFTEEADEYYNDIHQPSIIIDSFKERFKIKISTEGKLVTYKMDDLG